jgi:CRP-like cAMP-binding protein
VQQCHLFRGLPDDVCHQIAELLAMHHFAKGATIVRAGERRFSMFIVGEGMTKRTQTNRDGSALIEQRFIATQAFGRKSLLACQPQAANVVAETNVLLYELDNLAFAKLLQDNPSLLGELANTLAHLNWHEMHGGPSNLVPDPLVIERLVNVYCGQIEACYAVGAVAALEAGPVVSGQID